MRRQWFGAVGAMLVVGGTAVAVTSAAHATPATSQWSVTAVPLPAGASTDANSVARVACASDRLCALIVSAARVHGAKQSIAAMLRSGSFAAPTVLPLSKPTSANPEIGGVACSSNRSCLAAGYQSGSFGLLETFDGTSWTATQSPGAPFPGEVGFTDVSCGSTTCLATGTYEEYDGRILPLAVTRDTATGAGHAYTVNLHTSFATAKDRNRYQRAKPIYGPACAPHGACSALAYNGFFAYPSDLEYEAVRLPVPAGFAQADLYMGGGMSCASPTDCAALGTVVNATGTRQKLVAEVLRAGVLSARKVEIPSDLARLHDPLQARAISCPDIDRCVGVVGFRTSTAKHGALVVRYNGRTWHATVAPLPADAISADAGDLTGVSCPTAQVCQLVGTYRTATGLRPLVETLTGTVLSPSSPDAPSGDVTLQDVSCAQSTCLASGFRSVGTMTRPIVAVARPVG